MHAPGWRGPRVTRRSGRRLASALVAAVVLASLGTGGQPATANPPAPAAGGAAEAATHGDHHESMDRDNRAGAVAPSAGQRAAAGRLGALRWNTLGTPAALGPSKALATGLPADPETAARRYLAGHLGLFGLDAEAVDRMDLLMVRRIGVGSVVLLRQRFGDLPAGHDGLVAILVSDGTVLRVTSSLSRDTGAPEPATLAADEAVAAALRDAGFPTDRVPRADVRRVAVPTPADGPRAAYAVTLTSSDAADPLAVTSYVDARTGQVLVREDLVDFDSDNPVWAVFPATPPPATQPGQDTRERWCLTAAPACVRTVRDPVSGRAWDVDLTTGQPTNTTKGNSADSVVNWGAGAPVVPATPSPTRDYTYPFTDQWHQARCDPAVFASAQRNDADAALANLFAMHNRMHDWAHHLGFNEAAWNLQAVNLGAAGLGGDAEQGRAQAGALTGSRNNANQGTPRDGLPPTTNMFLWQPVAGGVYPPCVDGDFDMTVIGHEYTHAISNRMIAGPDTGIGSFQGGAMGESWSDLVAAEHLAEYGFRAPGGSPFVTGGYVTGNTSEGIRNYDGSKSPLNYSDVGYDLVGPQVHADGEIWTATNLRIRAAMVARYGSGTPALQARCADGLVPVQACPGNRRWVQLLFDSFLLQAASQFSMLNMRDNMLAADMVRFGGANQRLLWNAFAAGGMGEGATSGPDDPDPVPSFASPLADNATVTLRPLGGAGAVVRLYVGDYEARATPVADTDPATPLPDTFEILPLTKFDFVAVGPGIGHRRFSWLFLPGRAQQLPVLAQRNLAATAAGAVISGDGINLDKLGDETEATNWASRDGVAGKQVTVDLAGDRRHLVTSVNVSAMLRPALVGDVDAGGQNRFSALRSFEVLACDATVADCTQDAAYRSVYRSAPNAFPGGAFRPTASQLILRSFRVSPALATHLRLRVVTSQCTGGPLYAGEQDADPRAATDCATASPAAAQVRVAEFQAFGL